MLDLCWISKTKKSIGFDASRNVFGPKYVSLQALVNPEICYILFIPQQSCFLQYWVAIGNRDFLVLEVSFIFSYSGMSTILVLRVGQGSGSFPITE